MLEKQTQLLSVQRLSDMLFTCLGHHTAHLVAAGRAVMRAPEAPLRLSGAPGAIYDVPVFFDLRPHAEPSKKSPTAGSFVRAGAHRSWLARQDRGET